MRICLRLHQLLATKPTTMKIGTITKHLPYYAYGHFGYLYDTYKFNRAETL